MTTGPQGCLILTVSSQSQHFDRSFECLIRTRDSNQSLSFTLIKLLLRFCFFGKTTAAHNLKTFIKLKCTSNLC